MTPVQVLADTLQIDPTRIEAALKGHGLTVVHTDPADAWLAARGAITPRPDAPTAEEAIRRLRDSYQRAVWPLDTPEGSE